VIVIVLLVRFNPLADRSADTGANEERGDHQSENDGILWPREKAPAIFVER